jgi:hypothetical protein
MKIVGCIIAALLAVTVVGIVDRGGDGAGARDAVTAASASDDHSLACGSAATAACVPDVGAREEVVVDGLSWRVAELWTASRVGDTAFATGLRAKGAYALVTVRVHVEGHRAVTPTRDVVELVARRGAVYRSDPRADALLGARGDDASHPFGRIRPGQTVTATIAFDVPRGSVDDGVRLRFGELGPGSLHAFIRARGGPRRPLGSALPRPSAPARARGGSSW